MVEQTRTVARLREQVVRSVRDAIDRSVLSGPRWKLKALVAVLLVSLCRSFPSYDALHTPFVQSTWQNAQIKIDKPLADMARLFPPDSHESKLTFRLTVPVLAHTLRLGRAGILLVSALAGVLLLCTALSCAHTVTASKHAALFVCLATASTWPGVTGFHELRGGFYDAVALCLLLLGLSSGSPLRTALWIFLAAWTDERALIASSLVFLFSVNRAGDSFFSGKRVAIFAAWLAYFASRIYLAGKFSLILAPGIAGPFPFAQQANTMPLGVWSGLGGNWILVVCGLVAVLLQRRFRMAAVFCVALATTMAAALSVVDVTRSMAYCLPAVFVGMQALARSEPVGEIEKLATLAGAISFVVPTHYVQGSTGIWWLYPLPVQLLRWLAP